MTYACYKSTSRRKGRHFCQISVRTCIERNTLLHNCVKFKMKGPGYFTHLPQGGANAPSRWWSHSGDIFKSRGSAFFSHKNIYLHTVYYCIIFQTQILDIMSIYQMVKRLVFKHIRLKNQVLTNWKQWMVKHVVLRNYKLLCTLQITFHLIIMYKLQRFVA